MCQARVRAGTSWTVHELVPDTSYWHSTQAGRQHTCCHREATEPGKPRCRVQSRQPTSTPSSSALVAATAGFGAGGWVGVRRGAEKGVVAVKGSSEKPGRNRRLHYNCLCIILLVRTCAQAAPEERSLDLTPLRGAARRWRRKQGEAGTGVEAA